MMVCVFKADEHGTEYAGQALFRNSVEKSQVTLGH